MLKTLRYGWLVLRLLWEANGFWAGIFTFSHVYENTFYPFIQIFLLARLLDIFSKNHAATINDFLWIIVAYIVATLLNIITSRFIDAKDEYLFERLNALLVEIKIIFQVSLWKTMITTPIRKHCLISCGKC